MVSAVTSHAAEPGSTPSSASRPNHIGSVTPSMRGGAKPASMSRSVTRCGSASENGLGDSGGYLAGAGPFQEQAAQNMLAGAFLTEFYRTVDRWAAWGDDPGRWPDDVPQATPDPDAMAEVVRLADW